jgi:uncharacterized protein
MNRVVLDTNVLVSGTASIAGYPHHIIDAWRQKSFVSVTSPQILEEIRDVFHRLKILTLLNWTSHEANKFCADFTDRSFVTAGTLSVELLDDPDDNMIVACAIEGTATHVVSGNSRHFSKLHGDYQGIKIATPAEFCKKEL